MTYPPQAMPPGYPPQYPPQPGYAAPPVAYPPVAYPPQPAYYPPQPAAAQAPVAARGTLEDFNDQPSGVGSGVATTKFFTGRPQGSWLQLQVARDLTHNDVRQQRDPDGTLKTVKSTGAPKWELVLPTLVLQSSDGSHPAIFTDGQAALYIKGITADAFKAAMAAAGITDPGKALTNGKLGGATFTIVSAGEKPAGRPGYNPTKLYNFQYTPGGREMQFDADPTAVAATPSSTPPAPAPVAPQQFAPAPVAAPPAAPAAPVDPQYAAWLASQQQAAAVPPAPPGFPTAAPGVPMPPMPPAAVAPPAPVPGTPPVAAPPVADPEKAALLARLQGGQV